MNKKTLLTVVIFLIGAALFAAQQFTIDYLDGTVEVKTAKGWSALAIGGTVASDATVRVSKGGTLEISSGAQRISVIKDGTYAVSALVQSAQKSVRTGVGVSLAQKLHSVTSEQEKQGSAGGARAGVTEDELLWVEEGDTVKADTMKYLASGDYDDAINVLSKEIRSSSADTQEMGYLLSLAYYRAEKTALAYRTISKVSLDTWSSYYPDFMILKAQILLDSFSYADGLAVTKAFMASKTGVETDLQMAYLILGQCSRGLGDEKGAQASFAAGLKISADTETAKTISQLMAAKP